MFDSAHAGFFFLFLYVSIQKYIYKQVFIFSYRNFLALEGEWVFFQSFLQYSLYCDVLDSLLRVFF